MEDEPRAAQLEHWDRVGASYASEWDPPARNRLGERELAFLAEGLAGTRAQTALDVGIGSGRILEGLLRRSPQTTFYGLDLAPSMVEATRARLGHEPRIAELAVCDLAREPVPFAREFDFISAVRMLKYNDGWRDMVAKLVAQLAPDGLIAFSMENTRSLNAVARPYAVGGTTASLQELRDLCRDLGLRDPRFDGFTKLPHRVLSGTRSRVLAGGLTAVDAGLRRVLGGPALAREIFVLAGR